MYQQGIVWVITGDGKGKTTAAMGQAARVLGHDMSVAIIHFLKGDPGYGEYKFWSRFPEENLLLRQVGRNAFVDREHPAEVDRELAQYGWDLARSCLDQYYDLVILDELNVALDYGLLDQTAVAQTIRARPPHVSVIITGRNAPESILQIADTVSIIAAHRHHCASGIKAQAGMEY